MGQRVGESGHVTCEVLHKVTIIQIKQAGSRSKHSLLMIIFRRGYFFPVLLLFDKANYNYSV